MPLGDGVPLERGRQSGVPLKRRYFAIIGSYSVKMVADSGVFRERATVQCPSPLARPRNVFTGDLYQKVRFLPFSSNN